MEASELIERFDEANIGDSLLKKAFVLLANSSTKIASQFLECVEGMKAFDNYVSESEATDIVVRMTNADGTTGEKWDFGHLSEWLQEFSKPLEHLSKYNKWALYVTMNMMSSDYAPILAKWSEGDTDRYTEACYDLAVCRLTDRDRPKWIREYFHL